MRVPSEPTQTCTTCGRVVVVVAGRGGFPPETAKRRLAKMCKADGHESTPEYRVGLGFRSDVRGQGGGGQ